MGHRQRLEELAKERTTELRMVNEQLQKEMTHASELKKRLVRNKLGGRIVGIESVDRMTDRQIAAKVRRYFQEDRDKKGHL